jgi:hypothetical protein
MVAAVIPHLAWPFRMGTRQLATVEQDTIEDVKQNVHAFLHTARGERTLSPDFGLEDPTFGPSVDATRIAADIEAVEDRANVTVTATRPNDSHRVSVNVSVELAE